MLPRFVQFSSFVSFVEQVESTSVWSRAQFDVSRDDVEYSRAKCLSGYGALLDSIHARGDLRRRRSRLHRRVLLHPRSSRQASLRPTVSSLHVRFQHAGHDDSLQPNLLAQALSRTKSGTQFYHFRFNQFYFFHVILSINFVLPNLDNSSPVSSTTLFSSSSSVLKPSCT